MTFDPLREATELRSQLSSDKRRLAFLFGAGISQAVGIPGLLALTDIVRNRLKPSYRDQFARFLARDKDGTLETVLNRVRLCREMLGSDTAGEVEGLTASSAAALDRAICKEIRSGVGLKPPKGLKTHYIFAHWIKTVTRAFPLEIFTTNYDLLLEMAMESAETPYFDGFIGSVAPFFRVSTIDADFAGLPIPTVPRDWVRLWKLHGSIGWVVVEDDLAGSKRIVRRGDFPPGEEDELMVFPSRQKYADSRRLPFLAYQDRLRRLLASGETLLVIAGYSFADEHLNEIILQSLRSNPRLAVTALCFDPLSSEKLRSNLLRTSEGITNITIYGPDSAVIGGHHSPWSALSEKSRLDSSLQSLWDYETGTFRLGDFIYFVEFLQSFFNRTALPLPVMEPTEDA